MAGISAMGDLSHELETLVIQIDGGAVHGGRSCPRRHAGQPRRTRADARPGERRTAAAIGRRRCSRRSADSPRERAERRRPARRQRPPRPRRAAAERRPTSRRRCRQCGPEWPRRRRRCGRRTRVRSPRASDRRRLRRSTRAAPASPRTRCRISRLQRRRRGPVLPGRESSRRSGSRWRASTPNCSIRCSTTPARSASSAPGSISRSTPSTSIWRSWRAPSPAQGAAARTRNRDRSAGTQPAPGREIRAATNSIRWSSTATRRCSSSRARWPKPPATSRAFRACSRR